jgi:hypothetical protein
VWPPLQHVGVEAKLPFDIASGKGVTDLEP